MMKYSIFFMLFNYKTYILNIFLLLIVCFLGSISIGNTKISYDAIVRKLIVKTIKHGVVIKFDISKPLAYHVFNLPSSSKFVIEMPHILIKKLQYHKGTLKKIVVGRRTYFTKVVFYFNRPVYLKKSVISRGNEYFTLFFGKKKTVHSSLSWYKVMRKKQIATKSIHNDNKFTVNKKNKIKNYKVHKLTQTIKPVIKQKESNKKYTFKSITEAVNNKIISKKTNYTKKNIKKTWVIIIDPGHGGKDSGAIGKKYRAIESRINLLMAKDLKLQLTKHYKNIKVYLTRNSDVFIPLKSRHITAELHKADLFISLHLNIYKNHRIRGLTIYTLSNNRAKRENYHLTARSKIPQYVSKVELNHYKRSTAKILVDIESKTTMRNSKMLGYDIAKAVKRSFVGRVVYKPVRSASFSVLTSISVPSVLIEMGFLSNPIDEKNFLNRQYRIKLAYYIALGIDKYIKQQ